MWYLDVSEMGYHPKNCEFYKGNDNKPDVIEWGIETHTHIYIYIYR